MYNNTIDDIVKLYALRMQAKTVGFHDIEAELEILIKEVISRTTYKGALDEPQPNPLSAA